MRGTSFLFNYNWDFFGKPFPDGTPSPSTAAELWQLWLDWKKGKKREHEITHSTWCFLLPLALPQVPSRWASWDCTVRWSVHKEGQLSERIPWYFHYGGISAQHARRESSLSLEGQLQRTFGLSEHLALCFPRRATRHSQDSGVNCCPAGAWLQLLGGK